MTDLALLPEGDRRLLHGYLTASEFVVDAGFASDIDWAEDLRFVVPTPEYVMREAAFVILNSGFRFQVARKLWPDLTTAFRGLDPKLIDESCRAPALRVLRHERKINAIIVMAVIVRDDLPGIVSDRNEPEQLCRLPYIGPVTCYHLAKLLGADVVKPDVHLVRAARAAGKDPHDLCRLIASLTGYRITTVDSVLWRWGEQRQATDADWAALWWGPQKLDK